MSNPRVSFVGDVITYNGFSISMEEWRSFVQGLNEDAMRLCCTELLFAPLSIIDQVRLSSIVDDLHNDTVGYSFLTEPLNAPIIGHGLTNIRKNFTSQPGGKFSEVAYCMAVNRFLDLLIVVMLVNGGAAHGEDLTTLRLANSSHSVRSMAVHGKEDQVAITTMTGELERPVLFMRFMPPSVSKMLVLYLADVLPFLRSLPKAGAFWKRTIFLFPDGRGHWMSQRYEAAVKRETRNRLGVEITLEGYKKIFLAIKDKVMPGQFDDDGLLISPPVRDS